MQLAKNIIKWANEIIRLYNIKDIMDMNIQENDTKGNYTHW